MGGCEEALGFSCRNRWPELWRDDHREDGGQKPVREGGRRRGKDRRENESWKEGSE